MIFQYQNYIGGGTDVKSPSGLSGLGAQGERGQCPRPPMQANCEQSVHIGMGFRRFGDIPSGFGSLLGYSVPRGSPLGSHLSFRI